MSKKEGPFNSIEAMLEWQLEQAETLLSDSLNEIDRYGEVYTFSKERHGSANSLPFGTLTNKQLSLIQARQSFKYIQVKINKARADLKKPDFPSAIYRLIDINKSINSMNASWSSVSSVRAYRYIENYRNKKSIVAKQDRKSKPSLQNLLEIKESFYASQGRYHGWKTHAQYVFNISSKTLNEILKKGHT